MYLTLIEVEILRAQRRREGADGSERCSYQPRHHVERKGKRDYSEEKSWDRSLLLRGIMREANLTNQIQPEQSEDHDPEREEDLTV